MIKITHLLAIATVLTAQYSYAEVLPSSITCGTNIFAPYSFKENNNLTGIDVDVIKEIGERIGIKIILQSHPWKRLLKKIKDGDLDCVFSAFKTPERLEYMSYTNVPIHVSPLMLYTSKKKQINIHNIDDLNGMRIALIRGFKLSNELDNAIKKDTFQTIIVTEIEQTFKMLQAQRVDAVIYNHHVGAYYIKKFNLTNITHTNKPIAVSSAYITFPKKSKLAHLIPKFDEALFDILADGSYKNIMDKYVKTNVKNDLKNKTYQ